MERMHSYTAQDELADYLSRIDRNKIAILESGTVSDTLKTINDKQIVILTTQRYFSLTRDEIIDLTKYNYYTAYNQRTYSKRELILFDEKPYLLEHLLIDIATINNIDTALNMNLDDTINQDEKQWLISQWQAITQQIKDNFKEVEAENDQKELIKFVEPAEGNITEDDQRFLELVTNYKQYLNKADYQTYKRILATMQIFSDGATIVSKKIQTKNQSEDTYKEYYNYYHVLIDNQQKITNLNTQVVILDGSANISPDYKVDYVNMVDCSAFTPNLSNLTIDIVNVSTGKTNLCANTKKAKSQVNGIIKYIAELPDKPDAIFTYKRLQEYISTNMPINCKYAHFGDIKGTNNFRDCKNIIQIGINRYPPDYYLMTACFVRLQPHKKGTVIFSRKRAANNVMYDSLLAELEQNIYRSAIRNHNEKTPVKYTILVNTHEYAELIKRIQDRYQPFGAKINISRTPNEILSVKTTNRKPNNDSENTKAQAILCWIQKQTKEFKLAELLEGTGIKRGTYKDTLKRHPEIKDLLDTMRTKKGHYQPVNQIS